MRHRNSYSGETFSRKSIYDKGLKKERKFKRGNKKKKDRGNVAKDRLFANRVKQVNEYGGNEIKLGQEFGLEYSDHEGIYWSIRKPGNKGTKFITEISSEKGSN